MAVKQAKRVECPGGICPRDMNPPCRVGCPIDTKAPLYIRHISKKEYEEAWRVILEDNPFGMSCGHVCHHPCEIKCRAAEVGDPIAIRALKRFAAEKARDNGFTGESFDAPGSGKKVAVIGAGPAGLTAGYYLRKEGHAVTIFEASDKAGGMLAHAIPEYRLAEDDLSFDLNNILASGVEIRFSQQLGRDFSIRSLMENYDAVFIAVGSWASWKLEIEGEDGSGVGRGIEFLMRAKAGEDVPVGKRVAVIGGGNVAMDVARVALRRGAEQVEAFCLEKRNEMPAHAWEIVEAEEEGILINPGWGPTGITYENGAKRIAFRRCIRVFDDDGRFAPVYDDSIMSSYIADQVLIAIGEHPAPVIGEDDLPVHVEKWGGFTIDNDTLATNIDGVFAGGDCVSGPASLVEAIAAGKTAAQSIGQYLRAEKVRRIHPLPLEPSRQKRKRLIGADVLSLDRSPIAQRSPSERNKTFELIEPGYSEGDAVREAKRCLECDLEPVEDTKLRRFVQFSSLFIFNSYWAGFYLTFKNHVATIYQGQLKSACIPGLHCYSCPSAVTACPIGSIQFWLNNAKNNFRLETLNLVGLYVIGFLGLIGAAVGRAACGWLCPFGLFQDLMHKIPSPVRVGIPKFMRYFKYLVLLVFVFLLPLLLVDEYGLGLGPWFCKTICPSGTLVAGIPLVSADADLQEQIHVYFPIKLTILIIFVLWMIVSKRPFCRTTCPLGAFWSLFNKYSILRVRVDDSRCDDCNSCRAVCPVDIIPQKEVMTGECIRCMNCVNMCQLNAMKIEIAGIESPAGIFDRIKRKSADGTNTGSA